jgi:8-oxo-dGTP diphosphatase
MRISKEEWEASIVRVGVVAACLVKKDSKYLLVQEKQPKAYGLWNLPAGHIDTGESLEMAAMREAKEETGYDVRLIEEIALYHETAPQAVKHVFSADIIGGELSRHRKTRFWQLSG